MQVVGMMIQDGQKNRIGYGRHADEVCGIPYYVFLLIFCLFIAGCETTQRSAPVVDRAFNDPNRIQPERNINEQGVYIVQKGDTLYGIALKHDIDHEVLAKWNGIIDPRNIQPGQKIIVADPAQLGQSTTTPVTVNPSHQTAPLNKIIKKTPKAFKLPYSEEAVARLERDAGYTYPIPKLVTHPAAAQTQPKSNIKRIEAAPTPVKVTSGATAPVSKWIWPAEGKLLSKFSKNSKGIKISGEVGQPVLATAKGKVIYSGNVRSYGQLIVIKHNDTYLSTYAHNSKILVKESETVEQGQKIAEMGNSGTDKVKLHFEIRKNRKSVDPLKFLPSK